MTAPKRPRGRPRNTRTDKIAERLDISKRQAQRLEDAGVDETNLNDIEAQKLRKLKAEAALLERKLKILERDYVSAVKVQEDCHKAGASLQAALDALDATLPPMVAGLSEAEIRQCWRSEKVKLLTDFTEQLNKLQ